MQKLTDGTKPAATRAPQPSAHAEPHSFSQCFDGSLLLDYHTAPAPEKLTCSRLTRLALDKHWSPHRDISWSALSACDQPAYLADGDPFSGFAEYDELTTDEKTKISWQYHNRQISEILHGEQLALMCASQLITMMPCMESRLFSSTQAADEARHVEFFRRYLTAMNMEIYPPSNCLLRLTKETLQSQRWETKLLVCQILIESLALAQFSHLMETHSDAVLRQGLRRIVDDEARHVKFGTDYLKSLFTHLSPKERTQYGHCITDQAFALASSDNHGVIIARERGWNTCTFRHHVRRQRIIKPALFRRRFRQLHLNIAAIGLMNDSVRRRLERFTGT